MATAKKKRNKDSGSNDSVIASRILQDIINNSSESFRTFLQQQGIGGDVQPQQLAGGGQAPPSMWGIPGYAPPMQGPPSPEGYAPPINFDRPMTGPASAAISNPVPPIQMPSTTTPYGPTVTFEDGSQGPQNPPMLRPVGSPRMPWGEQHMSILDLLGIR